MGEMITCDRAIKYAVLGLVFGTVAAGPSFAENGKLTAKLTAYYTFNSQNLADSSGHGVNGTALGTPRFPGAKPPARGRTLEVDGKSGAALPKAATNGTTKVSVSLWFNAAATQRLRYNALVYRANRVADSNTTNWSDRTFALFWMTDPGLHVVYTAAGATSQTICLNGSLPNGFNVSPETWYNVVLTLDGPNKLASVYLDGALVTTCPISATSLEAGNIGTTIGETQNIQGTNSGNYTGQIDNVRFYDRVLSADDVQKIFEWRE